MLQFWSQFHGFTKLVDGSTVHAAKVLTELMNEALKTNSK